MIILRQEIKFVHSLVDSLGRIFMALVAKDFCIIHMQYEHEINRHGDRGVVVTGKDLGLQKLAALYQFYGVRVF